MQYYFSLDGNQRQGPVSLEQLRTAGVGPATMVWREGMADWVAAKDMAELSGLFASQVAWQEAYQPNDVVPQPPPSMPGAPVRMQYETPTPQMRNNGLATASMVLGIVGVVLVPCVSFLAIVPAILAIIFGHISRGQIRRGQGAGAGAALAGLIMGYIAVGLLVVFIGLYAFFVVVSPRSTLFTPATPSQPARPATIPTMPTFPQPKPFPTTFPSR